MPQNHPLEFLKSQKNYERGQVKPEDVSSEMDKAKEIMDKSKDFPKSLD